MKNHFHFLVRIKEEEEIVPFATDFNKKPVPSHQLSHLLNTYAQAFNKQQSRHGSLFESPFKRKQIGDSLYLRTIVLYIHNNPVHHGFVDHTINYPWSSYHQCISGKISNAIFQEVLDWFDNLENFKAAHNYPADPEDVEEWLGLGL
jgi:REP element-mobilizing transposase RayT